MIDHFCCVKVSYEIVFNVRGTYRFFINYLLGGSERETKNIDDQPSIISYQQMNWLHFRLLLKFSLFSVLCSGKSGCDVALPVEFLALEIFFDQSFKTSTSLRENKEYSHLCSLTKPIKKHKNNFR